MAIAPSVGFWMYRHSWTWLCVGTTALNLAMAGIAWRLEDDKRPGPRVPHRRGPGPGPRRAWIERRVLLLSLPLFLYAYGYGAISSFSAVYADDLGIQPKTIYLTTLALVTLVTRPILGRLGDQLGYRRLFIPCLVMMTLGLTVLPMSTTAAHLSISAGLFAIGFGSSYPVFAAYVMQDIGETRRGAAFGAILAAFDTGIGTGSTITGWLSGRAGLPTAFAVAAVLAAMALPMFLLVDKRLWSAARPAGAAVTDAATPLGRRPRGLMLRRLLAFLLVVWAPLNLAVTAAALLDSLTDRGWPAIVLLVVRLAVTGFGVAAGRALWNDRRGAIELARWATGLNLGAVLVTVTTAIWPEPLPPGVREPVAIATRHMARPVVPVGALPEHDRLTLLILLPDRRNQILAEPAFEVVLRRKTPVVPRRRIIHGGRPRIYDALPLAVGDVRDLRGRETRRARRVRSPRRSD